MCTRISCGLLAAIISAAFTVELSAQAPAGRTSPDSAPSGARQVTITGCVLQVPVDSRAEPGRSGVVPMTYVLTNVVSVRTGPSNTSGTTPTASTFRLVTDDSNVSGHIGHKIEVAGTVENPTGPAAPPTQTADASNANAPKIKVDSIKMVSAICP
jgi:hypothetical protein